MVAWPSSMRAIYIARNKTIYRLPFLDNSSPLSIALKATNKAKVCPPNMVTYVRLKAKLITNV